MPPRPCAMQGTGTMSYCAVADAGYLQLQGGRIVETDMVLPGIIVDFGEDGAPVGIEWLFGMMETGSAEYLRP